MKSMKRWMLLSLAAGLAAATPAVVRAEDAPAAKADKPHKGHGFRGKVTAVDVAKASVTLENRKGETKTFTVPADAKIKVDGKLATLADVKVGAKATVRLGDDDTTVKGLMVGERPKNANKA